LQIYFKNFCPFIGLYTITGWHKIFLQFSMKKLSLLFFPVIFISYCFAQEDTINKSNFMVNAYASFIMNQAYSNVPTKNEDPGTYSKPDSNKIKAGFALGTELLFLPGENFKILLGISFSRTSAGYNYTYISESKTFRPGFTDVKTTTYNNYKVVYSALNLQAGFRKLLSPDFFIVPSFLVNSPMKIKKTLNGVTRSDFSNNSGGRDSVISFTRNLVTEQKKGDPNLSFRLQIEYQFYLSDMPARITIFRNFGLLYKLPWWGLGLSFTIS
jgi:hypothetical protein